MVLNINGATQSYLADLNRTQQQLNQAQAEVTSGFRVQNPSDDPGAVASILQVQTDIGTNQQVQSNLGSVKNELGTADSALQSAVQLVENAVTLAAQGANSTTTADDRANIAQQVAGLQQTLVGISQTTVNGRYIFSGDQDTSPAYQLDSTQPDGVKQLISAPATRVIVDPTGTAISVAKTAQELFDARNFRRPQFAPDRAQQQRSGGHHASGHLTQVRGHLPEPASGILWRSGESRGCGIGPGAEISNATAIPAQQSARCRYPRGRPAVEPGTTGSAGGPLGRIEDHADP
ncbi:hypothetical protein SBA3_1010035 [Candidatus Sulfopaludibacter sp. SbA3]|nr:hypothetical protein SBA3_1010035 [Candidatus Sulfopaludibacter sp. SbA3]